MDKAFEIDSVGDMADPLYARSKPKGKQQQARFSSKEEYENWKLVYSFWVHAYTAQSDSRQQRMLDHEFYDGHQWSDEDIRLLEERKQPPYVFNEIKPAVDWITGTEKKNRIDYKVLPRDKDSGQDAETKTSMMKYISDVNNEPHARSKAFKDAVISGLGFLEVGIQDDPTQEQLFVRYVDWRDIWYDHMARDPYLRDARFIHRALWLDIDIAAALFPKHAAKLRAASGSSGTSFDNSYGDYVDSEEMIDNAFVGFDYANKRSRVRITVTWYKVPETVKVFKGSGIGSLSGMVYDPQDENHRLIYESGFADVVTTSRMRTRVMYWVGNIVLLDMESPYRHNKFPIVPFVGNRRHRDGTFYGVVRGLRDPQEDLNKRRSKALYILSTNKALVDDDAASEGDWQTFSEELARPDGIIKKKRGSQVDLLFENRIADQHIQLMAHDAEFIEKHSGVSGESMGRETNAQSGRAILARQEQGNVITLELFDNLRLGIQITGQIELSLIEQYYTDNRVIRLKDDQGGFEFIEINGQDEDNAPINDITARQADFVIDTQSFNATMRQRAFETLGELFTRLPIEMSVNLMDIMFELSDLPMRDELVQRIRKMTGQSDPDAEKDPAKQEELEAQKTEEERQAKLAQMMQELEIKLKQLEAQKAQAEIDKIRSGIEFDNTKLRIEKAKAANDIVRGVQKKDSGGITAPGRRTEQGPYIEKGMESNNKT